VSLPALEGLLHHLTTARTARELKLSFVDHVARALEADVGGFYLFDEHTGLPSELYVPLPDAFVIDYEQLARDNDRVFAAVMRTGRVVHERMAWSDEGWRQSVQYRAFARRYKIYHYLCAPISIDGRIVGTVNVGRSAEGHAFGVRHQARALHVVRVFGARLAALGVGEGATEVARARAERVLLRLRAPQLGAAPLSDDERARLWDALAQNAIAPLDSFESGGRHYLLLPAGTEPSPAGAASLTPRELDVARRVGAGEANKVVAYDLGISTSMVAKILASAMRKLGVRARVGVAQAVRRLAIPPR